MTLLSRRGGRSGRRRGAVVALCLIGALVLGSAAVATERWLLPLPSGDGEVLTLLLLGSDEGPTRSENPLVGRADGFQLLFVSPDRQHATFVSIPRDSWVPVAGRGTSRINSCLVSGPETCVTTVEREFGLDVDGYLMTSMRGFANAIDAYGGVTVDVPAPIGPELPDAGVQELNGRLALHYARDRKNRPRGDFDRSAAQAELLALGHREVHAAGDIRAVLDAVAVVRQHSVTDLSGPQLVRLAFEAMHLPPDNVSRELAPARHGRAGAASVVFLQPRAYEIIRDAAADGRID